MFTTSLKRLSTVNEFLQPEDEDEVGEGRVLGKGRVNLDWDQ